jgi:hypothetical protein
LKELKSPEGSAENTIMFCEISLSIVAVGNFENLRDILELNLVLPWKLWWNQLTASWETWELWEVKNLLAPQFFHILVNLYENWV